jgi:predicted NBD/HSP70 family sugar kinase
MQHDRSPQNRDVVHKPMFMAQAAQGADYRFIREVNRLLVLNCVREQGPIARVRIAQRTGLSRTTVSNIMDDLLRDGFVREGELLDAAPAGGRRAMLVHFNADIGRIIGIDVGRTHLAFQITDLAARVIAQWSGPFNMQDGPEICLAHLISKLQEFVAHTGVVWEQVIGMGLGIPGPLDAQLHTLSNPPGMPMWDGVNVWQALHDAFNVPLYLDNDANMGAFSENRYGAGSNSDYLAYLKVGTGIGAGLILNKNVYRGNSGSAGELGHVTIDENGPWCYCGNRGCLETLAGAQAIVHDACYGLSLAWAHLPADTTSKLSPEQEQEIDITDVIAAAQEGDVASRAAIEHAGERIGIALAGLINLFNPSTIVIGGGVTRANEIFLRPLRQAASSRSLPAAWEGTRIVIGNLDDSAVALGAVSLVLDAAFQIPTTWALSEEETTDIENVATFYRTRKAVRDANTADIADTAYQKYDQT